MAAMTRLLTMTSMVILLTMTSGLASCSKKESEEKKTREASFMEFSLLEASYKWINIDNDHPVNSKLIIINSDEELRNHIIGEEYPTIDFSKHSLLLISGSTRMGVEKVNIISFQQLSTDNYKLDVEVLLNDATVADTWIIILITSKLGCESKINTTIHSNY
jgi:hypothetical protein